MSFGRSKISGPEKMSLADDISLLESALDGTKSVDAC